MKKISILQFFVFITLAIVLIPIPFKMKDGGTVHYNAILWDVYDVHRVTTPDDFNDAIVGNEYIEGTIVLIFGKEVFNNTIPYIDSKILTQIFIRYSNDL